MLRFQMPGLSRYWCYPDGRLQYKVTGEFKRLKTEGKPHYRVVEDNDPYGYISPQEIIQYGKHLASCQLMKPYIKLGIVNYTYIQWHVKYIRYHKLKQYDTTDN